MAERRAGYTPGGPDNVLDTQPIGPCWCVESAFRSGGVGYVVSSGGTSVQVWSISSGPTKLIHVASSPALPLSSKGPQGYFTTVSSNAGADPIIWTVSRGASASAPNGPESPAPPAA